MKKALTNQQVRIYINSIINWWYVIYIVVGKVTGY